MMIKYYQDVNEEVYKYIPNLHPFIDYIFEDKSSYEKASTQFTDKDDDFLIGLSGGVLMNIDFVFVGTDQYRQTSIAFENSKSGLISDDGVYCQYKPNSTGYNSFWKQETRYRRKGMIANCKLHRSKIHYYNNATTEEEREALCEPLRITGDHYNYLNYGRIMRTPNEKEKIELDRLGKFKVTKIKAFPRFWDGDYWNFKVDELVTNNSKHLCKAKARRKGYSFKRGSQGANTLNLNPDVTIVLAAYDIKYLTDPGATSDMLKTNLDWYENKTYWKRGYLSEDMTKIELGFKQSKTGNKKYGFRSKGLSVSCQNNPDAPIGKDAIETDFEESGRFPNLQDTLNVTFSTAEAGDTQVGTIRVYGTGGTKGANWQAFSDTYYTPYANNMLAMENVWDKASRHTVCGFFHPQIWNYEPHIDNDGNSYLVKSFQIDKEKKIQRSKTMQVDDYNIYVGQRANSPNEAFNSGSENIFSSIELNEHINFVKSNIDRQFYRDGNFYRNTEGVVTFKTNDTLIDEGNKSVHPFIVNVPFTSKDDIQGCWRIYHEPKTIGNSIPSDLYYGVIDPIGRDKSIKEVTIKNSLNSIYILSYPNELGIASDIIQAVYIGREEDQESASRQLLLALEYFNAKGLAETDRGTVVADFRRWHKLNRLIKNPMSAVSEKINQNAPTEYGVCVGTGERASEFIIGLKNWLYTPVSNTEDGERKYILHYIYDLPTLLELQRFNNKGNFDRISALRLAPLERLAYITKSKKPNTTKANNVRSLLSQIGMYQGERT